MATYKIGNKVNGIIRSFSTGKLGKMNMTYDNQPYTILRDISATVNFAANDKDNNVAHKTFVQYNADTIDQIRLSNVPLTEKVLDLIYKDNPDKLYSKQETYQSDEEGNIYLNTLGDIYQVFIYNDEGNLESAYGTYSENILHVEKAESIYSIYYSYLGEKSYYLDKPDNFYITLDLEILGNEDDNTQDMCLHIEKAAIKVDKNMYFNNVANSIDLTITVIYTGLNYLTIK